MNRLEENRVTINTAINSSFYKNVFLLTQVVPSSFQFQQYFRKDMFDKPNTAGFLHVSHYLSIIYDAKLFKQMVKWPILCKKDEITYRVEIKKFFSVLSRDNPDIKFPSILMSHLVQSSGSKFLIFMWKLSQLVLKSYIQGEHSSVQGELLNVPHTGRMDDLTMTYFKNINAEMCCIITNTYEETKSILDTANSFINDEIETLNMYKVEIFERKKSIKKLVPSVLVHPLVQERLIDVEDLNIIDLWKMDILEKLQYIHRQNEKLNKFKESCYHLCKIVLRIKSNSEILDANQFPKIRHDYYSLHSQLYKQDGFSFSTLLSIFHMILMQMLHHVSTNFSDVSPYLLHIQSICEIIISLRTLFVALNMRVNNMYNDEQTKTVSQKTKHICPVFNTDNLSSIINQTTFLQSPKITFNFSQYVDDNLYDTLSLPLLEGKHKHLFKRYKRKYCSYELSAVSNLNNSWSNMIGWLSPRIHCTKHKYIYNRKLLSPLYSRLLYNSKLKLKPDSRENICSPSYESLNLTPRKRRSSSGYLTMKDFPGRKTRDLFNSTIVLCSLCVPSDAEN